MKTLLSYLLLSSLTITVAGCNTWSGIGQDMQKVGSKIQAQGDKVKH